jgi:hypothetical protein
VFESGLGHNRGSETKEAWVLSLGEGIILTPEERFDTGRIEPAKPGDRVGVLVDFDTKINEEGVFLLQFYLNREKCGDTVFGSVDGSMVSGVDLDLSQHHDMGARAPTLVFSCDQ